MAAKVMPKLLEIPLSKIKPDPNQPRKIDPKAQSLESLTASIKRLGVRQPIAVRPVGKGYMIVFGERRWRAAKAAGLKTIPAIVSPTAEDAFERAAVQLAENLEREGLSPMETAEFLADLRDREKKTMPELLAELAKLGIENVSRTRVEKLLEFVNFPLWLKDLLRDGTLNETHAVHLIAPNRFPAVMDTLYQRINYMIDWAGGVTVKQLQREIENCYRAAGRVLKADQYTYVANPRQFDLRRCRGCEMRVKIGKVEYCMDPAEFDRKNKEALDLKAAKDAEEREKLAKMGEDRTNPADGIVHLSHRSRIQVMPLDDGTFDTATCEGCPHRHMALYEHEEEARPYCFHVPCFDAKAKAARKDQKKVDRLENYLDSWLRPRVLEQVTELAKPLQVQGLMFWLATGAISRAGHWSSGQRALEAAHRTKEVLVEFGLTDTVRAYTFGMNPDAKKDREAALARAAVKLMDKEQLRWFAKEIGLSLDRLRYRIDEGYLRLMRKGDVLRLAQIGGLENARGGVAELKQRILSTPGAVDRIGVPADLQAIWVKPFEPGPDEFDRQTIDEDLDPSFASLSPEDLEGLEGEGGDDE